MIEQSLEYRYRLGFSDEVFYRANKKLIDDRLKELSYTTRKNWLLYGDHFKAREYFRTSYRFNKLDIKLYIYWILSRIPIELRQYVLNAQKKTLVI